MNRLGMYWVFLFAFIFLTTLQISVAQESGGELITVTATGMGSDSDSALKNAFRAAIEQAVGTMVDAETLAQNDDVISDQVLSYSQGYIQSHKVLGEPKNQGGLVSVKIKAQVKRTPLVEKLKTVSISTHEVEGDNLFAEVTTKIDQRKSGAEMLVKALEGFPENVLEVKLAGKPEYDDRKEEIVISVYHNVNLDKYKEFYQKITKVLNAVAKKRIRETVSTNGGMINGKVHILDNKIIGNDHTIALSSKFDNAGTSGIWEIYFVDKEIFEAAVKSLNRSHAFSIDIVDGSKDTIVFGKYNLHVNYLIWFNKALAILPLSSDGNDGIPQFQLKNDTLKWNYAFKASLDEVKKMRNVVINIETDK